MTCDSCKPIQRLKQAELQKRDIHSVVEECIERYFSVVYEIQQLGYKVFVWNVIPSCRHDSIPNKEFPAYGTCLERNYVTRQFNNYLMDFCSSSGAKFISIFDELIDEYGLTRMEYYFDYIHLSQKAMPLAFAKIEEVVGDLKTLGSLDGMNSNKNSVLNIRLPKSFSRILNIIGQ